MGIILYLIITTGITVLLFVLFPPDSRNIHKKLEKIRRKTKKEEPPPIDPKEATISKLEGQVKFLKKELEKTKNELTELKEKFEKVQREKEEAFLKLEQQNKWVKVSEGKVKSLQEQNVELKRKLSEKEKEVEKVFSENVKLNKEIRELLEQNKILEGEKKKLKEEIENLKIRISRYEVEIEQKLKIISELRRKEEMSSFVSEEEYNKLKEENQMLKDKLEELKVELTLKKRELELKEIDLAKLIERLKEAGTCQVETQNQVEFQNLETPKQVYQTPQLEESFSNKERAGETKKVEEEICTQESKNTQDLPESKEIQSENLEKSLAENSKENSLEIEIESRKEDKEEDKETQEFSKQEIFERKISLDKLRNIGIMAHIDAGKTTLTERILYYTGCSHKIGEVHEGKAQMDWMPQEKERGITITSATTTCYWKNFCINIIDTPGHVDFTAEVRRSLRVLDGAIIIFSAVEGVEAQTEAVWYQCQKYKVPRLIFINKMDRRGANFFEVVKDIEENLKANLVLLQIPLGEEENFRGVIDFLEMKAYVFDENSLGEKFSEEEIPQELMEAAQENRKKMLEKIASLDESLLEKYLAQKEIEKEELINVLRKATIENKAFPVFCGSALKNKGVQQLLDGIVRFLPSPLDLPPVKGRDLQDPDKEIEREVSDSAPFTALAFKIQADPHMGKLIYFRVYSGALKAGSYILNATKNKKERIGRLFRMHANQREQIEVVFSGDIAAAVGLGSVSTGDTLCDFEDPIILEKMEFPEPVVFLSIKPKTRTDQDRLGKALSKLLEEDPTFKVEMDQETQETLLCGMGELHLEIIVDRLKREFKVNADVGKPKVAYRETIQAKSVAEGKYIKQTGGRGQYGHVVIELAPLNLGEGFKFIDKITGGRIPKNFIPAVEKGIKEAMKKGPFSGFPVTDIQVTLLDGSYHEVDSSELAFKLAAIRGFKEAFVKCKPVLLEPYMSLEVLVPEEYVSNIIANICQRRGKVINIEQKQNLKLIIAEVPLAEMFGYANVFRSLSSGRAQSMMHFKCYNIVPPEITEKILQEEKKGFQSATK